ncbi:MAG: hypothetical protein L3K16_00090 [Thermoplasmata archaeon]|nr:hypothetical protein [Thermoplasmata archaeon]
MSASAQHLKRTRRSEFSGQHDPDRIDRLSPGRPPRDVSDTSSELDRVFDDATILAHDLVWAARGATGLGPGTLEFAPSVANEWDARRRFRAVRRGGRAAQWGDRRTRHP